MHCVTESHSALSAPVHFSSRVTGAHSGIFAPVTLLIPGDYSDWLERFFERDGRNILPPLSNDC